MADFLSRLAARTLGVAPIARLNSAATFAQGPALAGSYPLTPWPERELSVDSVLPTNVPAQRRSSTFAHSKSLTSLVPEGELSTALSWQSPASSEDASTNPGSTHTHDHHTMIDGATTGQVDSLPSLPMSEINTLVTSIPEAPATFREIVPDRPLTHPLYSMERSPFQSEHRASVHHVGTLDARPVNIVPPGNPRTSLALPGVPENVPNERIAGYPQEALLQEDSRSFRRLHNFTNGLQKTVVEHDTQTQVAPSSRVQTHRSSGELLHGSSHPDVPETRSSATLPRHSIASRVPRPTTPNRQGAQAQQVEVPSPEPTIHVTIGRIEVRATPPPPEQVQHQQRSTAPVMSLEQYLQQRSKGGD